MMMMMIMMTNIIHNYRHCVIIHIIKYSLYRYSNVTHTFCHTVKNNVLLPFCFVEGHQSAAIGSPLLSLLAYCLAGRSKEFAIKGTTWGSGNGSPPSGSSGRTWGEKRTCGLYRNATQEKNTKQISVYCCQSSYWSMVNFTYNDDGRGGTCTPAFKNCLIRDVML